MITSVAGYVLLTRRGDDAHSLSSILATYSARVSKVPSSTSVVAGMPSRTFCYQMPHGYASARAASAILPAALLTALRIYSPHPAISTAYFSPDVVLQPFTSTHHIFPLFELDSSAVPASTSDNAVMSPPECPPSIFPSIVLQIPHDTIFC